MFADKKEQTSLPEFIARKAKVLESFGVESAAAEVEWILCFVTGFDRLHLYLHGADFLTQERLERIDEIIEKRLSRYPLQYILEESWFYGRKFFVSPAVMVPTPETESLVLRAIGFVKNKKLKEPRVLDIGVGSGVISVSVAAEIVDAVVVALDISEEAIEVAQRNAEDLKVTDRIEFRQSDLFESLKQGEKFDLILSNPPYIAEPDYAGLMKEVLADPKISLVAGAEGMDIIKELIGHAPDYLADGGRIMFEIGYDQSEKVAALTETDERYTSIEIIKDLNDIDRIVILGCDR